MKVNVSVYVALLFAPLVLSGDIQAADQSLAATLEVYVFPSDGQASNQQSKDEGECYKWAVNNTGFDPFQAQKDAEYARQQAEAQKQSSRQATQGAGARGAVRGAARGALIGEIANDDASKGAAWGAAAGAVRGRRSARAYEADTAQQADQYAASEAAYSADKIENFKKAFSACLEAKKYTVKY